MRRERQKAGTLVGPRGGDRTLLGVARDETRVRDALDPHVELGVEIFDGTEHAGGEEGVAKVANGAGARWEAG